MKKKSPTEDMGTTQTEIVRFILDHPDGVSEPTIREHLADKLQIKDPSNIKAHLEKLSNLGVIKKERFRGRPNRWILAYKNQNDVGQYIIHNFIQDTKYIDGDKDLAVDVFKSRAMQKFIKESDWKLYLNEYLFESSPSEDVLSILKSEPTIELISPLVALSPTLFYELYEPSKEGWVLSVSLSAQYEAFGLKNEDLDENVDEDPCELSHFAIGMRVISALLLDRFNIPSVSGDIEKFLSDNRCFTYKWMVAYDNIANFGPFFRRSLIDESYKSEDSLPIKADPEHDEHALNKNNVQV